MFANHVVFDVRLAYLRRKSDGVPQDVVKFSKHGMHFLLTGKVPVDIYRNSDAPCNGAVTINQIKRT